MDMTEAEYVDTTPQMKLDNIVLTTLDVDDRDTIFNVIIMEEDKERTNGE